MWDRNVNRMGIFRRGVVATALVATVACGGRAETNAGGATKPQPEDSGLPDAGSVPTTDGPAELVMACPSALASVRLKLPCQIGQSFGGGLSVMECDLAGAQNGVSHLPPISLFVPMAQLGGILNMPIQIPFDNLPHPPPGGYGTIPEYPGERFEGTLSGTAVFSRADDVTRSFMAQLPQAQFVWTGDQGDSFTCTVTGEPFWAVAGDFI